MTVLDSPRTTLSATILGLCMAAGLSSAGYFVYKGIFESRFKDRYVTVKGLVERVEKADRGMWEIVFKVTGNELPPLYQKLSKDADYIQGFILKAGFEKSEISLSAPRVTDLLAREYGSSGNTTPPDRFVIEYSIFVNSAKVEALNLLTGKTGELLSQGIAVSRSEIRFYLDKFNQLRPLLIAEATRNAREMAKSFATETASQIGSIRSANQGTITLTGANASPNNTYDDDLSSMMKKIRVVLTVEFYLE